MFPDIKIDGKLIRVDIFIWIKKNYALQYKRESLNYDELNKIVRGVNSPETPMPFEVLSSKPGETK